MARYKDIIINQAITVDADFLDEVLEAAQEKDLIEWLKENWKPSEFLDCVDDEGILEYCQKRYPEEFKPSKDKE